MLKKGTYKTKFGITVHLNEDSEPFNIDKYGAEYYFVLDENNKSMVLRADMIDEETYGTGVISTGANPEGVDNIASHSKPLGTGTEFPKKKKKDDKGQEPKTTIPILKRGDQT